MPLLLFRHFYKENVEENAYNSKKYCKTENTAFNFTNLSKSESNHNFCQQLFLATLRIELYISYVDRPFRYSGIARPKAAANFSHSARLWRRQEMLLQCRHCCCKGSSQPLSLTAHRAQPSDRWHLHWSRSCHLPRGHLPLQRPTAYYSSILPRPVSPF